MQALKSRTQSRFRTKIFESMKSKVEIEHASNDGIKTQQIVEHQE